MYFQVTTRKKKMKGEERMQLPVDDGRGRLAPTGVTSLQRHCHAEPSAGAATAPKGSNEPRAFPSAKPWRRGSKARSSLSLVILLGCHPLSPQRGAQASNEPQWCLIWSTFVRVKCQGMYFCICLQDSGGNTPKNLIFHPNLIFSLRTMTGGPS